MRYGFTMDSDDLSWFLACAQAGSLSAAAKARGVAVSTVARRLDAIEARLKLRLTDRGRDGIRLTLEGERIAGLARKVVDDVDALERAAISMRNGTRRRLIVSATESVIADILAPALPKLQRIEPELLLDLRAQAAVVSLAGREADLAIRMSAPEGSSLLAKKLGTIRLGLYASESYLAGRDAGSLNLGEERLLGYDDSYGRLPELDALAAHGLIDRLVMTTNSTRALLNAALAGAGIALLPRVFARGTGLVEVAGPALPARTPFLVTHRDLRAQPDIRTAHAWIVKAFADALSWSRP